VFLIRIYSLLHKDIGIQVVGLENMVRILTVLVLGGAGFLGRRVVRRLFETGEGVRVLDLVIPPRG
jgi:FlaA1/EpsC-like NDP-sugar epimerase